MNNSNRLTGRNALIAAMFEDGEKLKNYYRFVALNPHINLHDACNILIARPDAKVCYPYEEWNELGRQVIRGKKSIAYYDYDGYKQYVFDVSDTRGDNQYLYAVMPTEHLLVGLTELTGIDLMHGNDSDYAKILKGTKSYLQKQGAYSYDERRNELLAEGVAYSLYSKTGLSQNEAIGLSGLPFSYKENADFVKEVYVQAELLGQEIEDAYKNKQEEVKVIDDTEEETVSDEPVVPVEQIEPIHEEQPKVTPYYQKYLDAQKLQPQAVVVMRLGDFYEIMGENAKAISAELDLTLTGREVGLPERVPMCGMPYHAMDKYLDKILKNHSVLLVDEDEEPKYIASYAEALGQTAEAEENAKPVLTEITDDEPTPFDDEQSETDEDWRNELADELTDLDEQEEPDEPEEIDDSEQDEPSEQESKKPNNKPKSTPKKPEQGIKDRKRKDKPQPTLFDLMQPQEKSAEEALVERQLKYGSGVQHGKFRIFDKYNENPSATAFAEFLKKEYGWGGHGGWNGDDEMHDGKGITMSLRGEKGEYLLQVSLKWSEVAIRIADLIDDDNYLSEQEKKEYISYKVDQNRLREQQAEEERQKNELINKVILSAPDDRKQRILDEYAKTTKLSDIAEFLKNEYGTSKETAETYSVTYNAMGAWIFKGGDENDYRNRIYLKWEEFADKVCNLIENDRYIEQPAPQEKPQTNEHEFNRFKELTAEGKAFFENYQQRYRREPTNSPWDEVQHCRTIANGIYEVSTAGHGGVMISAELAPHILSPEALQKGLSYGNYLCYEEDCDACIPLRELYDKGILKPTDGYFTHYYVKSDRPEAERGSVPFDKATEAEKAEFFKWWNNAIDESLAQWNEKYWQAHEQAELSLEQEKIKGIVERIVKEGTENTSGGNWIIYFDEFKDDEQFVRKHKGKIGELLALREEVAQVEMDDDGIDTTYYLDFCPNTEEEPHTENIDLTGVLDQSELGGAKTRFKGNVSAIRLVNKLYLENRNPTEEERKVLSQFVGWGGLSQAFDENNESWKKEYAELKGLLSQEDYEQARSSTLNAYYTAKDVITGIYMALNRFGVKGNNRILEPSMGTGNFFGYMPKEIAEGARLYGVELDNLTGRIATKLYPQANVQIKGFEDTSFPNDKFDIVVGNVPFGGYGVADSDYNKYNFKVHDYFLAKSLDKVKPNGIVAIVTSKGTMDKINQSARKYVAERAELLGAIRLPNTAFKQTAGTEAVADILFFRKRTERINTDTENIEWLGTGKTAEGYEINQYFINHPEMVLGTLAEETGLYGGVDTTVKPDGRELSVALSEAINHLPQDFYSNPEAAPEAEVATIEDYNVKPFCYKAVNGKLYMRIGDELQEQPIPKFPKDAYQRIESMVALREELHHVLDMQSDGCSDEVLQREQEKLNRQYDLFVRRYGNINSQTNTRLFKEDGGSALLFACEDIDEETKAITKADVFSKRTIRPYVVPTSTDDCFEALQISKNERGKVDISYIEELTGKSYDDVLFELGDTVFRDPEITDKTDKYSGFVTAEEYLSGFVRDKLNTARYYARDFPEFQRNVDALEQVQPTPITASEIAVRLGQTWVDKEYYKQFYCRLVGVPWYMEGDVELFYNPHDSSWRIDQKDNVRYSTQMRQKQVYGTARAPAYRLFIDSMNLRPTTIYDTVEVDGQEKRVLNQAETIAAREKQNKIKEEFANWIFKDPERREELEATYNRLFNRIKLPSYDGSYLKFPGMNPAIELKPHQKNAIHRIITSNDSTLLHHVVGSGKTYTMVASIMKMRQLGLCNKAMVTVPNHLVQQWASEWRKLYPNAKILVATKEDLEKDNRRRFVSKVAMGDWDGIIIAQSSFAKIPISYERQVKKLQEEIENIELTIKNQWEEKGMPRGAVKNLERIKKSRKAQLQKLMDDSKKDSVLNFESLGIDYLFVDEAHYYKNLFLFSKMSNVAGISNAASQRASDLKLKCEYLQELHGNDRGVVFATGTPISNSMTEMYTMQTYLQPSVLKDTNIRFFDGWAADFGETITSMELAPSGQGYRARTRFAKFTNLPELLKMYRSFADVQTADMVKLNVPESERKVINLKPSDTVINFAEEIAERAERIYAGRVDSHIDNMLKVTSDGKKLALDPRCYVATSTDEEGNKLNAAAQRIYEIWESTADIKGTQIVFCDLSTPKRKFEDYDSGIHFDAYNELKHKLVQKGIPIDEIAFIHDATTDEQKQALFDSVNSGAVRVLIGSTEKCGAGTNVQKRLVALHHLDTPYRPSDMAQREGRIIRQGNTNEKVQIYTYVTERTFDSYSYQILENKQRFISQIDRGDLTVREAEDIDETTLTYAEIKAITAANPKIKRKMEVDTEIARLRVLEGQYKKNIYDLQDKIRKNYPEDIRKQELLIERVGLDLMHYESSKPTDPEAFEISVNGKVYTDKKEGGQALLDAIYGGKPETIIAEYCGFKINVNPMSTLSGEREITLTANGQYTINVGDSAIGNLQRMDNFFNDLPARKERLEKRLAQLKEDVEIAKEQVEKPFEQAEQLASLISEQTQLNTELNLDKSKDEIIEDNNDSDEDNYRMLPTEKDIREVNIIDEEDKVAAIKVEVLPDYCITQKDMHKYGYTWDGMLPIKSKTASIFWILGLPIYKLNDDNTQTEVRNYSDFNSEQKAMYGVEKPDWEKFINKDKNLPYFFARSQFAEAAGVVASGEMDNVDERFTGDFIETNYEERADLDDYLADKPMPEAEAMKVYTSLLLEEFSGRIWRDELKYYGWDELTLKRSIVSNIENEELKAEAKRLTVTPVDEETAVINSVRLEYDGFKKELLSTSPEEIYRNSYKIHLYNEFSEVIQCGKEYLSDKEFQSLYEERGHILYSLYDDYIGAENYSVETYSDTALFIKDYCEDHHNEIYYPTTYYGKDTENRAYYSTTQGISLESLRWFDENADADMITVAAPACYVSQDELEKHHIFYLNIGRDIQADELVEEKAISNMMNAMDNYYRIRPVYLQTAKYANEHYEMIDYRNSHKANEECRQALAEAIRNNFDGMHLNADFEDKLIEKYGMERVAFIVATTINEHNYDGRYSRENKAWAKTIPMSESEDERSSCCLNVHPAVLDGFTNRIRKKINEKSEENQKMEQDKYLKVTPMGYKVLSITKDKDNRNIAIIHREEQDDYIVAARYDTSDGKWAQGKYCSTLEAAEEYKNENYNKFVVKDTGSDKKNWIFAHVAKEALVAKHQFTSFFRFPTYSEYAGYGYSIFNNRIKEGRQIADMQSDSRELCYDIRLADDEEIILKHSSKEEIKVTGRELMELVSGTTSKDYDPKPRVEIKIPKEAKRNVYENSTMFVLPNSAAEDTFTYFIPNRYISNGTDENEGKIILSIPEDFEIKAQNKEEEEVTYSLQEFADLCNGTTADDYKDTDNAEGEDEEKSTWHYVSVDKNARIAEYDNSSLFKMPKGEFGGYTYYIPNGFLKENEEKGTIRIGLPEDFVVKPKDNVTGDEISMTVEEFVDQIKNKKPESYRYFKKPSDEAKAQFGKVEERLRKNIPEEMKSRPNWVAITTFEKENGKLGKRPIDCNTGKYASDNDPATWADFDTACKFARENGLLTLGYALDGEDKVACIDLDGCMQENGDFTELAQKTFNLGNGTYCEKSVSGKGLHVFGKTDGMDLRSFSKDGDMEFYRKARFIAVTGDYYGSSELVSFDNPEMKELLESKFDKRPEIKNAGKGVEGFSTMSDRDVYDKACSSYRGDRFKALFEGQDLQNNHSNSDMSLMNLLAFWCNGDKDQMLRMFAASGLYRPEKSADYYECTMLKALEGTTDRYNPQPKTEPKKPANGNSSGNNGKR